MPLMLGRRPPKRAPALRLRDYLTGTLPAVPVYVDYLAALGTSWEMLGNDTYGDCVAVTWANTRRLVSTALGSPHYPAEDEVLAVYKTQNPAFPAEDNGMDIQSLLEHLTQNAGPDGAKAVGFATVDHNNVAEVKAAIALFGSVWTGVLVQDANQAQFGEGLPWDWSPSGNVVGGHSIITGGYGDVAADTGQLSGDEKFITWAQETSFTDNYWANGVDEAWVVIWPEHLGSREFMAGVDLATLADDYQQLTGSHFPAAA